jgi:ABC-type glycerol-3-phosphate transport system substrate-binding protein
MSLGFVTNGAALQFDSIQRLFLHEIAHPMPQSVNFSPVQRRSQSSFRHRKAGIFLVLVIGLGMTLTGCWDRDADPTPKGRSDGTPKRLRVLVIDGPEYAKALEEFWQTQGEGELAIEQKTQSEIRPDDFRLGTDIIVFPGHMLPELASRHLLSAVRDETWIDDFEGTDLLPAARKLCYYDGDAYAAPLSNAQLLLGYRTDLFQKHSIDPPKTWAQYMDAVRTLNAVADKSWSATCEPLGSNWRSEIFFSRNGSFIKHRNVTSVLFDTESLDPQLSNPAGLRSISQLVEVAKLNSAQTKFSPSDTFGELLSGKAAMAITLPSSDTKSLPDGEPLPIAFIPLPGSGQYYSVRQKSWEERAEIESTALLGAQSQLAAVAFESAYKSASFNLIATLANSEGYQKISSKTSTHGITRGSQLHDGDFIPAALGAESSQSCQQAIERSQGPQTTYTLRLPNRSQYLQKLDGAIEAAISGQDVLTQLKSVEEEWDAISNLSKRDEVLEIYRNSVGQ